MSELVVIDDGMGPRGGFRPARSEERQPALTREMESSDVTRSSVDADLAFYRIDEFG